MKERDLICGTTSARGSRNKSVYADPPSSLLDNLKDTESSFLQVLNFYWSTDRLLQHIALVCLSQFPRQ